MEKIKQIKGTLSIDRVSFLVFSPSFCLYQENEAEARKNEANIKYMNQAILNLLKLDDDFPQGQATRLFAHHYRTKKAVDLQLGSKLPITKKLSDEYLIYAYGSSDVHNSKKYIHECSYYGIRVEYNPNNSNLDEIKPFLSYCHRQNSPVRISRLDIAIDYPVKLKPEFVLCSGVRKSFLALGNEGIETVYFGSRNSKNYFRIYNKAKELKEVHNQEIQGDLWRIELENKESFLLSEDTPNYTKVFEKILLLDGGSSTGDWLLDLIKLNAINFGLTSVLNSMPSTTKKRYKKLLSEKLNCVDIEHPSQVCEREFYNCFNKIKIDIFNSLKSSEVVNA